MFCWFVEVVRLFVILSDISRQCQPEKVIPLLPIPVSLDTMTGKHQRVDNTTSQTAQPSELAVWWMLNTQIIWTRPFFEHRHLLSLKPLKSINYSLAHNGHLFIIPALRLYISIMMNCCICNWTVKLPGLHGFQLRRNWSEHFIFVTETFIWIAYVLTWDTGGRRSPAVACWASDHWVASSNPLRGKFRN